MVINAVAAYLKYNDKYLIAKRTKKDSVFGKWEFPGGKIEDGESMNEAIEREIREEFDVEVKAERFLTHYVCEYPEKTVDLNLIECVYVSGDFNIHEDHSDFKFVSEEEFKDYDFALADIELLKNINKL